MTRSILIVGNESSLFMAAAAEAAKRVETFASAVIPNRFPLAGTAGLPPLCSEARKGVAELNWNPGSPISARTLVLAAENRLEKIDEAILVCLPPAVFKSAETLLPEEIDILVNDQIRGWFFLVRELVLYFRRAGAGALFFAAPELGGDRDNPDTKAGVAGKIVQADLLGPSALASFRSFAQGILATQANEPFQVTGFTGYEAGAEAEFAAWLFRLADERAEKNRGRWIKFPRRGFFR